MVKGLLLIGEADQPNVKNIPSQIEKVDSARGSV